MSAAWLGNDELVFCLWLAPWTATGDGATRRSQRRLRPLTLEWWKHKVKLIQLRYKRFIGTVVTPLPTPLPHPSVALLLAIPTTLLLQHQPFHPPSTTGPTCGSRPPSPTLSTPSRSPK